MSEVNVPHQHTNIQMQILSQTHVMHKQMENYVVVLIIAVGTNAHFQLLQMVVLPVFQMLSGYIQKILVTFKHFKQVGGIKKLSKQLFDHDVLGLLE